MREELGWEVGRKELIPRLSVKRQRLDMVILPASPGVNRTTRSFHILIHEWCNPWFCRKFSLEGRSAMLLH